MQSGGLVQQVQDVEGMKKNRHSVKMTRTQGLLLHVGAGAHPFPHAHAHYRAVRTVVGVSSGHACIETVALVGPVVRALQLQ